jgi:hypothetical protein
MLTVDERTQEAAMINKALGMASSVGLLSSISARHGAIARCAPGSPLTTRK